MNDNAASASERLAAMRRSFDEGFAPKPAVFEEGLMRLLLIRVAGEPLAFKTVDITAVARIGHILPLSSRIPELLGITAIRGVLVSVFDLAALLGFDSGGARPRWVALTRGDAAIAMAFDDIEGQCAVPANGLFNTQESMDQNLMKLMRIENATRAVADMPAIVDALRTRAGLKRDKGYTR